MAEFDTRIRGYDPYFNDFVDKVDATGDPRYVGLDFPLQRGRGKMMRKSFDYQTIKADLLQLILTEPGERVMLPRFGTGLRAIFFEQRDMAVLERAKALILAAIDRWEKRIVVKDCSVRYAEDERPNLMLNNDEDSAIVISIDYALKEDLQNVQNLVFRANYKLK